MRLREPHEVLGSPPSASRLPAHFVSLAPASGGLYNGGRRSSFTRQTVSSLNRANSFRCESKIQ